jgi:choline monooxygenase
MELVETLPSAAYCDPVRYQDERKRVFWPAWLLAGYSHQFNEPGDYIAATIVEFPIFVQLGNDLQLRAFHNVCAHRAGPIVWDGNGRQANLVCRYHGWSYAQNGELRSARDFGVENIRAETPSCLALLPVRVETWRGMIFICMDQATPNLSEWLKDFPRECDAYPIETYVFHSRTTKRMACNWKTYADNFLEGYHVPFVHPGLNREVDGLSYRVISKGDRRWNVHEAEPRKKESGFTGVFLWFWPNFSLNILNGGYAVERWLPKGHDSCDLVFEYFFDPSIQNATEIVAASEAVAFEDVRISEAVQRNLEAGIYQTGTLSPRHENGLADFKDLLTEVLSGQSLRP